MSARAAGWWRRRRRRRSAPACWRHRPPGAARARSNLGWRWSGSCRPSSRNRGAAVRRLERPMRSPRASVKAPLRGRTAPIRTDSRRRRRIDRDEDVAGAARFGVSSRATSSLPVPFSPRMRRWPRSERRARPANRSGALAADWRAGSLAAGGGAEIATARLRSVTAAWREVRARRRCGRWRAALVRPGLETKSVAPRFIASTAMLTPPWAVIITTTACGSLARISPSQWKPSAALVAPRPKLASRRTTSAPSPSIAAIASSGAWKLATSSKRSRRSKRAESRMSGSSSMTMQRQNGLPSPATAILLQRRPEPDKQ